MRTFRTFGTLALLGALVGAGGAATGFYIVRPGDTLGRIAARTGVPAPVIAQANGIVDADRIYAGARLRLTPAPPGPRPAAATVHVVRRGETLASIARRYGTTVAALARANAIADPNRIRAGQRLVLSGGGAWRCPVAGPSRFVNDWGFPREGLRFHQGTDLFAPRGTPVVAPVAGVASRVLGSRAGRQVTLVGSDGFTYVFAHLDAFGAAGRVGPGAVLGRVGTSGNAAGSQPHLHFEIHALDGTPINPYPVLVSACRR
jgi:murein DD-endopeptidase MepM/ murein hydrolase activator NlpD